MSVEPLPAAPRTKGPNPITEFFRGFGTLIRGFSYWRSRPRVMALGLIPAAIVFAVMVAVVIVLALNLDGITTFLTGFAQNWEGRWRDLLRIAFAFALVLGLVVVYAFTFTALTLAIGDWFYERIWRAVEADLGGFTAGKQPGFFRSLGDGTRLIARAVITGLALALIGAIPFVGAIVASILGAFLSGRLVVFELTTRPLAARGLSRLERRDALRAHNPRVLGFGVAVYLCFLIPGGAIAVMPGAVAGSTVLAKHILGEGPAKVTTAKTGKAKTPAPKPKA